MVLDWIGLENWFWNGVASIIDRYYLMKIIKACQNFVYCIIF